MLNNFHKYLSFNDFMLLGALLVALGLSWNTVTAMQRNYRLQQKYDQLQAEVELLDLQNQNLKYNIAYLKTNDYLELAARDKFSKSLPGENLVYLPGNSEANRAPVAKNTVQKAKPESTGWQANLQAWWKFLRGKQPSSLATLEK